MLDKNSVNNTLDSLNEDTVTTGNVLKGGKVQYGALVKPKYPRTFLKSPIHESLGEYIERVDLEEDAYMVYDSIRKLVTYYESGEAVSQLRCTKTDWDMFTDEVADQIRSRNHEDD